tara:strand:- start:11787 stop:12050 length:264 start_codon:yes stop_codon:yes gene_type:complete
MTNGNKIETIDLNDFLSEGIIKEKKFLEKLEDINWSLYSNKKVLIKGCASVPVPTWAYMMITAKLTQFANQVLYGEICSAYTIYKKN